MKKQFYLFIGVALLFIQPMVIKGKAIYQNNQSELCDKHVKHKLPSIKQDFFVEIQNDEFILYSHVYIGVVNICIYCDGETVCEQNIEMVADSPFCYTISKDKKYKIEIFKNSELIYLNNLNN